MSLKKHFSHFGCSLESPGGALKTPDSPGPTPREHDAIGQDFSELSRRVDRAPRFEGRRLVTVCVPMYDAPGRDWRVDLLIYLNP